MTSRVCAKGKRYVADGAQGKRAKKDGTMGAKGDPSHVQEMTRKAHELRRNFQIIAQSTSEMSMGGRGTGETIPRHKR